MSKFGNSRTVRFLSSIPTASIESNTDDLAARCKFNFSYFCVQEEAGQTFSQWTADQQIALFEKLTHYSKESLNHWKKQPVGKSGSVLAIYGAFPSKSDFKPPSHVPHEAKWGRFRLDHSMRLVGFVIPDCFAGVKQESSNCLFDSNTFYVVFLDSEHQFWKSESR